VVLDVREPSEWHQEGIIEGSETIFFADLPQQAEKLNRNRRIAVTCSVGNRASTAASILKRKGFVEVSNVLGGMTAWQHLGYPTVKAKKQE
jgi:hydroxyacylglutathione hydrolase